MEIAATAGSRHASFNPAWLWVPVFLTGLAAALAGQLPPWGVGDLARAAGLRLFGGDLALGWAGWGALAASAAWIMAKPLAVIGAILLLELRFSPAPYSKNNLLAWASQIVTLGFLLAATKLLSLLDLYPEPLFAVEETGGAASLLLVSVPFFLLTLLVYDVFVYWAHRAQHHVPFLWRFHRLHHSLDIDVLHNVGHPVDHVFGIVAVGFPTALLIGASQEQLYLLVAFTSLQGQINHMRLPINLGWLGGRVFADNRYHFIHHSLDPAHVDKNFADRFPFLDMLFGTYVPRGEGLLPTGLIEEAPPRTLKQYLTVRLDRREAA